MVGIKLELSEELKMLTSSPESVDIKYTEHVVAFFDVLGFRETLKDVAKTAALFNSILDEVAKIANAWSLPTETTLISDSIVLSCRVLESKQPESVLSALRTVLRIATNLQASLAVQDHWLRGGITIGDLFQKEVSLGKVIVGKALSDAYVLEKEWAKVPRVLVDPRIFTRIGKSRGNTLNELREEVGTNHEWSLIFDPMSESGGAFIPGSPLVADGVWVNYAAILCENEKSLRAVTKHVATRFGHGQEHYAKYKWVQSYLEATFTGEQCLKRYGTHKYNELLDSIRSL